MGRERERKGRRIRQRRGEEREEEKKTFSILL
jgi:hypothetical protein